MPVSVKNIFFLKMPPMPVFRRFIKMEGWGCYTIFYHSFSLCQVFFLFVGLWVDFWLLRGFDWVRGVCSDPKVAQKYRFSHKQIWLTPDVTPKSLTPEDVTPECLTQTQTMREIEQT